MKNKVVAELLESLPEEIKVKVLAEVIVRAITLGFKEDLVTAGIRAVTADPDSESTRAEVVRAYKPPKRRWGKLAEDEKLQALHFYKKDFATLADVFKSHPATIRHYANRNAVKVRRAILANPDEASQFEM